MCVTLQKLSQGHYTVVFILNTFSPVGPAVKDSLLYKLRWVTLGYHYDWTNKLYHKERHSPFPTDLSLLSRFILASACGFPGFRAEAAIVNYYHFESTLSGHTDHSESDLTFPLISIRYQLVGCTLLACIKCQLFLLM